MFNKLKSVLKNGRSNKTKGIIWQDGVRPGNSSGNLLGCSSGETYENTFPNINRIAEAFAEVRPYAVDSKGRRLAKQPELINVLNNPNTQMSGPDFAETLITMMLVHPIVYLLCWRYEGKELKAGGPITKDNIAGFTFLQGIAVSKVGGVTTYMDGVNTWGTNDVIALSLNVNPYQISAGYSPTQAVKKWASVDDYIADYQAGVFRNGAVPAGEMIITAPTVEAYNEIVDELQAHHRGANNANNIIYSHRPTSSIDGKPMAAGLEWVPFAQSNKDMTLEAIFNQANKKIDMTFGVPEEVKGYLQNSNYASAEVADYVFSRRVIYPKLRKVWSKFSHEMNRVTGGRLGFDLSFDYELPVLTDTRKVQTESLTSLLSAGFTVESAVDALQLPRSFLKLAPVASPSTVEEDNPQAQEDTREKPAQNDENTISLKSAKAKGLNLWNGGENSTLAELLKIYDGMVIYDMAVILLASLENELKNPVEASRAAVAKSVSDDAVYKDVRTLILAQLYYLLAVADIEKATEYEAQLGLPKLAASTSWNELDIISIEIQTALTKLNLSLSMSQPPQGFLSSVIVEWVNKIGETLGAAGLAAIIPGAEGKNYSSQIDVLLVQFAEQTINQASKKFDELLGEISPESTAGELKDGLLAEMLNREIRWSISEQHRAEELGRLLAAVESGEAADLIPMKTWHINPASPDVCADCIAINGESVRADQPFSNGDMVPHYHPHCYCTMSIDFIEEVKQVKVCCPKCGRYMMESTGGVMKNVICANSKCKKHYDIEVKNGKINATEVK